MELIEIFIDLLMSDMQNQNAGLNVVCLDFILILHLLLSDSYPYLHIHVEGTEISILFKL